MVTLESKFGVSSIGKVAIISRPFPLVGHIAFGIIDRGYNNLQVRVSSLCPLSCLFCSVAAGPHSSRETEFLLNDSEWFAEWVKMAIKEKGSLHLLFDGIGDPITHRDLKKFVEAVKEIQGVLSITVETRLFPASRNLVYELWNSGVDRFNVSIDTLNEEKAKILSGNSAYSVERVRDLILYARKELGVEIHITPLWLPGLNDIDIEEIISFAIKADMGGRIPPLGIQKYVAHKYGRKAAGVKEVSWSDFRSFLEKLQKKFGIKLLLSPEDFGLEKAPRLHQPYRMGDSLKLTVVGKGLLKHEYLAIPPKKDRVFTLVSKKTNFTSGDVVASKIIRDKDGVLIAVPK
jgi:uncharacterized Fe-S cluster-containing radical SAM superfamily enzyme